MPSSRAGDTRFMRSNLETGRTGKTKQALVRLFYYDGNTASICGGAVSRTLRVEGQRKKTALVCLVSPMHCRHKHAVKHHEQLAPGWFVTNEKGNALFANHFLSEAAADSCSGFADFRETALPLETMISFVASAAAGNFDSEEAY